MWEASFTFINFLPSLLASSLICMLVFAQSLSCLTLCDHMNCRRPDTSVREILQARILEWVAISTPGDLPDPEIQYMDTASPTLQVES